MTEQPIEPMQVGIEFVGGPYDGKVIGVYVDLEATGAPQSIDLVADPGLDPALWAQQIEEGTEVERYRGPAGEDELEEAMKALVGECPVKYRYTGRAMS